VNERREDSVTVRERTPDDGPQAAEVSRLAKEDLRQIYRPTDVALKQRSTLASTMRHLVAVVGGRVVGVVQYRAAGRELCLLGLGVHPSARRRGVARALVQHAEGIARDCGYTDVTLHTVRETGNVDIFERLGFIVESEAATTLFQSDRFPNLSEVAMRKRVAASGQIGDREPGMDTTAAIVEALERAPSIVVPLVREVQSAVLKRRPAPKKWSVHEHACHLAVVHRLFIDRLDQILASPSPVITPYDPGQSHSDDLLLGMDLDDALRRYVDDRRWLVERLRQLSPGDWNRTAEHPQYSHYSVIIMFRHLALHDFFHAYRIEELLLSKEWSSP